MKQSVAKSLGVAALGAAFAAAGAGAANAAPDAASALGPVSSALPAAGLTESLGAGQQALGSSLDAAAPKPGGPTSPVQGLLGGVPAGSALNGLPLG